MQNQKGNITPNKYVLKQLGSQCTYNIKLRGLRAKIAAVEKLIITSSGCMFVALDIQNANAPSA